MENPSEEQVLELSSGFDDADTYWAIWCRQEQCFVLDTRGADGTMIFFSESAAVTGAGRHNSENPGHTARAYHVTHAHA
ncbi:hypothetical protein RKD49_007392 [Streptomyces glaucescens]|jgi:hypothetical protein